MKKDLNLLFKDMTLAQPLKKVGLYNPLITQRFGADPYALIYEGRVYIYMTGDVLQYDKNHEATKNTYSAINTINVISSDDLVNWTEHGAIFAAGPNGASKWGNNSWAPAAAWKEINGKAKFFLYFANSGNGIGVLTADSPTGPFIDPLQKPLVSRQTPNCANVQWLFDPAVLVDKDGKGYLYFGGGVPEGKAANPGTGRVVALGEDMISLEGEPKAFDIPYLFEDSGINRIGDTYYYSYCSNFQVEPEDAKKLGFANGEIIYMTSDSPMGPFTLQGSILKNPGDFFGCNGNNHHCMFEFKGQWYIAYHSQMLEDMMGLSGNGYRCTHIDPVTVNPDGSISPIEATRTGVKQVKKFNPYEKVKAGTMATMAGISTTQVEKSSVDLVSETGVVCHVKTGSWMTLTGVDFGETGAMAYTASVKALEGQSGVVQIRTDSLEGEVIGYLEIEAECLEDNKKENKKDNKETDQADYKERSAKLLSKVTGTHDLFFIFYGEGYEVDYWYFS